MNAAQSLEKRLREKFPGLEALITPPVRDHGVWHLDLKRKKRLIVVEVHSDGKIGVTDISGPNVIYGQSADAVYEGEEGAFVAITALIQEPLKA